MKVLLMRGIPGSGKSYEAKKLATEHPEDWIRINWDDLRNMFGKYWVPEREPVVIKTSLAAMEEGLRLGYNIIIDNMNISERSTRDFIALAKKYKAEIEYKDMNTPLDVCIERDSKRDHPIGEAIIRAKYAQYKAFCDKKEEEH